MLLKLLLATAAVVSLWSIAYAQGVKKTASAPSSAKCLVEVKGVHYIGDVCKFTKIDDRGSFKLFHERSGLIVQVNVAKKDQGNASWNGPLGQGAGTSIGSVYRTGACWDGDDTLICAWSMKQDVYLGPTPPEPNPTSTIFWGSRIGMFDEIASRQGIDSSKAKIITAPSRDGVIIFCRHYSNDYSNK
jgi:hypothetical protein